MATRDLHLLTARADAEHPFGVAVLDSYVEFVSARCRPNTVAATVSDLGVFFSVIDKDPLAVTPADVLGFIAEQRRPRGDGRVVRLVDGEAGLSDPTVERRVAAVAGLVGYVVMIGEVTASPVPRGLSTRRRGRRSGVPLIKVPRTLPKVLEPGEVNALLGAWGTWRGRAMLEAMVLGGLRRCEVLGLRLEDLRPVERRVFIADGKGGHQRLVPMSARFFTSVGNHLDSERTPGAETN